MSPSVISELAISLPFKIDQFGTVNATNDQEKVWADRVRAVIGTALGERVYRPQFGCEAALGVYEDEEILINGIADNIRVSFEAFLPLLSLDNVEVTVEEFTRVIYAEVVYSTASGADYLIKVGIATIDGVNPISEDISWQTL